MNKYETLFRSLTVNGLTLKNRIIAAPTSMSGFDSNGYYNEETYNYFKLKAMGGAALECAERGHRVILCEASGRLGLLHEVERLRSLVPHWRLQAGCDSAQSGSGRL